MDKMEDEYDIEKTDSNAVKNHNEPEKVGGRRCCGKKNAVLCDTVLRHRDRNAGRSRLLYG